MSMQYWRIGLMSIAHLSAVFPQTALQSPRFSPPRHRPGTTVQFFPLTAKQGGNIHDLPSLSLCSSGLLPWRQSVPEGRGWEEEEGGTVVVVGRERDRSLRGRYQRRKMVVPTTRKEETGKTKLPCRGGSRGRKRFLSCVQPKQPQKTRIRRFP